MRESGRVSSKWKTAGGPASTSSEILPVRSASRPSPARIAAAGGPATRARAAIARAAAGSASAAGTTPTGIWSGPLARKAKPRATASSSGKAKTQKIASGSRRNSLIRAEVSSNRGE